MSIFIAILKCIFCVEDDEDRQIRYQKLRSYDCDRNQRYYGQTTASSTVHNECNPSRTTSTFILRREPIDNNSVPLKLPGNEVVKSSTGTSVSGINSKNIAVTPQIFLASSARSQPPSSITTKPSLSSFPEKPSIKSSTSPAVSGITSKNIAVTPQFTLPSSVRSSSSITIKPGLSSFQEKPITKSSTSPIVSGFTTKNIAVTQQFSLQSSVCSQTSSSVTTKPSLSSSITTKPSLSSFPEKPSELPQKLSSLGSSSSNNVSSVDSTPLKPSPKFPIVSHSLKLFPSASETGKPQSPLKVYQSSCSTAFGKAHSPKPPPISMKPTLSFAPSSSSSPQEQSKYIWVEKGASTYVFPKESLIEKDIVPGILKMPLSKSSYKDYFHALLYAEDCYLEKWDGFEMENVTLELHDAAIYTRRGKHKQLNVDSEKDEKTFVAFELDKIPERRPFLLSRDFVSLQPSNRKTKTFQGVIYRVVKSNLVLAEFGETFYFQHRPDCVYDVKFSFNRVCLKRAHQAIATASDHLFRNILFPNISPNHELPSTELFAQYKYRKDAFAVCQILRLHGAPPHLLEGPMSVTNKNHLSRTGIVIVEAIIRIFRANPSKRVLLCAPVNRTCDMLLRGLKKEMAESDMFRANAAFREIDGVPEDTLPCCFYEKEMELFPCPSLEELKKYKVILTTFMSSFRLYGEGMKAGYFSHIFLVDASSATEPESMIPLANFANDTTTVVLTGTPGCRTGWVRSKIARENGLRISYFERLHESGLYRKRDPKFITQLEDTDQDTNDIGSSLPRFSRYNLALSYGD